MKAIVHNRYGSSEVLEYKEIDPPVLQDDDVLLRVIAASVNAGDLFTMRGSPWLARLSTGLPRPKDHVLGWDAAGVVEAIGKNVTRFKPGDAVYCACSGTFADYARVKENVVALKPASLSFEQAAAVPTAGFTALKGLRDAGKVQPGQKVLINGASGGVGTFAVQIAKALGAEVTGVCSTRNVEMVRSLGADHVVDYTQEDFTRSGQRYDLILDNAASRSFSDLRRALTPQGVILPNSGHGGMTIRHQVLRFGAVHAPAGQHVRGKVEQRRYGRFDRAHRSRQGQARHRPDLSAARRAPGLSLSRRGARARQGRAHYGAG